MKVFSLLMCIFLLCCKGSAEKATEQPKELLGLAENPSSYEQSEPQVLNELQRVDTTEIIRIICKKYNAIVDKEGFYEKKVVDLTEVSSEGGTLEEYYYESKLRKKVYTLYASMGKSVLEYFYDENQLFFVFRKDLNYDRPAYVEGYSIKETVENQYYFHNERLIGWLDKNKKEVLINSDTFRNEEVRIKSLLEKKE